MKKIEDSWKQKRILHKTVQILIILTKNIFKYLRTQQYALDLHDNGGDGVEVVEEAGATVGVSPHLDMVDWAAQEADEDQQQTDLDYQDLGYRKDGK